MLSVIKLTKEGFRQTANRSLVFCLEQDLGAAAYLVGVLLGGASHIESGACLPVMQTKFFMC